MNTNRKNEILAGIFFIIATVAPISTIFFTGYLGGGVAGEPAPDYLARVSANETQTMIGMLIELVWALAVVGIPVVLHPILKKYNEAASLGFFTLRFIESVFTILGSVILLTLLTLSQEFVKAGVPDGSYYQTAGALLLSAREWAFIIGPGIVWALSALILNCLLYQTKLIPRWLSVWGFIGAALAFAMYIFQVFSFNSTDLLFIPIAVQEMVFALWLIVKGFNSPAVTSEAVQ
jgi:hypothetical protein